MKKSLLHLLAGLALAAALAGCETVKGIGRDITSTGSAVQGLVSRGN